MKRYFSRVLVGLIVFSLMLALAAGVARGEGVARKTSPGDQAAGTTAEPVDGATLITLVLVGGTALLAGGVWLNQMQRLSSL